MAALPIFFFFTHVSLFENFWCLHALEKRLEIWQGWCIPGGNQDRFGQIVSLWKAWLCMLGRALQRQAAEVPVCKETLATAPAALQLRPAPPFSRGTPLAHMSPGQEW